MVEFAVALAKEFKNLDGEQGHHRYQCTGSLGVICAFSRQDKLTEAELMLWRRKAVEHIFHYAATGFHVVPKFHLFQHMPQHIIMAGVPRTFWVYSDESKNGQVKYLWTKFSNGWSTHEQIFLRLMWLDALERL